MADTNDGDQQSTEGDARRELIKESDRVFRGETDEVVLRVRRTRSGDVAVFSYD